LNEGLIRQSGGNCEPTVGRSERTAETSASIVAIFGEILETVVAMCANIARTNARAPRGRSYGPIVARSGLTLVRLEATAATCGWIAVTGEAIYATISGTADALGETEIQSARNRGKRVKGKEGNGNEEGQTVYPVPLFVTL
jgi:hypothetical protein